MPNSASHRTAYHLLPLRRALAAKAEPEPEPEDDIRARFGRRLRKLRLEQNFNQTQFAKFVDIDRSYLSEVENGHIVISLAMLEVLALKLGITLSQLVKGL